MFPYVFMCVCCMYVCVKTGFIVSYMCVITVFYR